MNDDLIINRINLLDLMDRQFIYHYTKTDILLEKILPSNKLKFNSLLNLNDPLEFENFFFKYDQAFTSSVVQAGQEINDRIKHHFKVACFSQDIEAHGDQTLFRKGYCRPRMWAQYADNHRGVCLIFKRDEFLRNLQENVKAIRVPDGSKFSLFWNPVRYTNDLSSIVEALTLRVRGSVSAYVKNHIDKYLDKLLFTKLLDYSNESEYRYGIYSEDFKDRDEIFVDLDNTLEGIILGARYPSEYVINVYRYSDESGIPIFAIEWTNGDPGIDTKKTRPLSEKKWARGLF